MPLRASLCGLLLASCVVKPLDLTGKHCAASSDCGDGFECAASTCHPVGSCSAELCDGRDNDCDGVVDDGCLFTVAGRVPGFVDGDAAQGALGGPGSLSPGAGGVLWFADRFAHAVRRIAADGTVTTVAGTGRCGFKDGASAAAELCRPWEVVEASSGALLVSDSGNHAIRKIENGQVTTVAGNGVAGFVDDVGGLARFREPRGVHLLSDGTLLIADSGNHRLRALSPAGRVSTRAGTGVAGSFDAMAAAMQLNTPSDVVAPLSGDPLYVSERHRVRRIAAAVTSSTLAGAENSGARDSTGTSALFDTPLQLALDSAGATMWVADSVNDRLRTITVPGGVTESVIIGGGYRNGPAMVASVTNPTGVAVLANGELAISDGVRVRRFAGGQLMDHAGGRWEAQSSDGPAAGALLSGPRGLARLDDGTWLWVEPGPNLVRALWPDGGVSTIAGALGTFNSGGDDGAFGAATVDTPYDVAALGQKAYVAEWGNHVIRLFDFSTSQVSVFAGAVKVPGTVNGPRAGARFNHPTSVAVVNEPGGPVLYVGDPGILLLRKIDLTSGEVSSIAGDGSSTVTDGCREKAGLLTIDSMTADGTGQLWITDGYVGNMVRHVDAAGCIDTLYPDLGGRVRAIAFEPPASLLAAVDGRVLKLNVGSGDKTPVVLFPGPANESPVGWQDGTLETAAVWQLTGIRGSGASVFLVDGAANRLRRLER